MLVRLLFIKLLEFEESLTELLEILGPGLDEVLH